MDEKQMQMNSTLKAMLSIVHTDHPSSISSDLFRLEVKDEPEKYLAKKNIENYKTKLLLNGCSCDNCKLLRSLPAADPSWCPKSGKRPNKNICEHFETHQLDLFEAFSAENPSNSIFRIAPKHDKDNI